MVCSGYKKGEKNVDWTPGPDLSGGQGLQVDTVVQEMHYYPERCVHCGLPHWGFERRSHTTASSARPAYPLTVAGHAL
jgi:hypothetical protein